MRCRGFWSLCLENGTIMLDTNSFCIYHQKSVSLYVRYAMELWWHIRLWFFLYIPIALLEVFFHLHHLLLFLSQYAALVSLKLMTLTQLPLSLCSSRRLSFKHFSISGKCFLHIGGYLCFFCIKIAWFHSFKTFSIFTKIKNKIFVLLMRVGFFFFTLFIYLHSLIIFHTYYFDHCSAHDMPCKWFWWAWYRLFEFG